MFFASRFTSRKGIRQLSGKIAVITGAASGIGRALAVGLWSKGCDLALVDVDGEGLASLDRQLNASGAPNRGQTLTTHVANVADRLRMQELAREVVQAHGAVHVLINNAGIGHEAAFPQTSLDDWDRIVGVNLWGAIHGCHFFMPHLAKVERAHIVNISSLFGIVGMNGQTAYCTTKFAVRGLSESLWEELRETSVGLTVVHPGGVATNIMKNSRGDDPELLERLSRLFDKHAIPPERASRLIIRAIEKGTSRLLITPEAKIADLLKRLIPVTGNKLFGDVLVRATGEDAMRAKRRRQWQETMVESRPENDPDADDPGGTR